MNSRKLFRFMGAGSAVLGLALCVPAALLAQSTDSTQTAPPPPTAQSGMGMHHRPSAKRQLRRMTKQLNLTSDQQQQMLPILQDRNKQMKAMHDDTSLSPQQRRQQTRTLMQDSNQKMEAVMTDSQKQQFEQMQQQRHEKMQNRRMGQESGTPPPDAGNPPPPPPPPQS